MKRQKEEIILHDVTVEAVAAEGKALAHVDDGIVLFMEFAVPGDVVDVKVYKRKKNYMEGRIVRIVKPSPDRLQPFCEHFGVCGGCRWQTLPYHLQLEAKRQQVYDQLVRIGHLEVPEIRPVLGSEKTAEYRNKLEYSASNRRWLLDGEPQPESTEGLGFHVSRFFDKVLDIKRCHLQAEPSNAIRLFIREYALRNGISFYDIRENRGELRTVIIRNNAAGTALMVIVTFGCNSEKLLPLMEALAAEFPQITSLYYVVNTKGNDSIADQECVLFKGDEAIFETMEGLRFKIGPKSFYQTNSLQALQLYRTVREFAGLDGSQTVYDLYTGTGTIAQFVSAGASKVIGIEYVPEAIQDAVANAELNGISNCTFFAGDMKDVLNDEFIRTHGSPDVIITDPPRAGMHPDVCKVILAAAPRRIVYVSCNPASQARDLAMLSEKYRIVAVQPVDMFPHTLHVENVCKLERL
ncbi:MAG: 23S rRNA (uracil(1939)-C(5))-methyltransferase RlmD [Bacteroidales bacterium]|nr:23S rRNA (uracil(1939)-C(5))-methyltransferase RlmD [Bacteroidales bacterium]